MPQACVVAVLNLKGGVGKTHSAWLLASVCQERKRRVLLIDTDTQGNLSSSFLDEANTVPGVEMLLHPGSDHNPLPLVRRTPFAHIDIIPSSPAVARFDESNKDEWEKSDLHRCFVDPIRALTSKYDYIVFDCPPRLSLVSFAALTASNAIIIPMETADWVRQGHPASDGRGEIRAETVQSRPCPAGVFGVANQASPPLPQGISGQSSETLWPFGF